MTTVTEFSIPASQFALGKALQEVQDLEIELDRMIPTDSRLIPYFWVRGDEQDQLETVLARESELATVEPIGELDGRTLYRAEWDVSSDSVMGLLADYDLSLQEASGDEEFWDFLVRFCDPQATTEFYAACRTSGLDVTVQRLHTSLQSGPLNRSGLTDGQRSLVELAYDEGYFDVPRATTVVDLADELGISDQAANERLRRGLQSLVETTLKSASTPPD